MKSDLSIFDLMLVFLYACCLCVEFGLGFLCIFFFNKRVLSLKIHQVPNDRILWNKVIIYSEIKLNVEFEQFLSVCTLSIKYVHFRWLLVHIVQILEEIWHYKKYVFLIWKNLLYNPNYSLPWNLQHIYACITVNCDIIN